VVILYRSQDDPYLKDVKYNLINNELKKFFNEHLFEQVIGMTNAQIGFAQREEDGMNEDENLALFKKENKEEWLKMLGDTKQEYRYSEIYQAWVELFGLPFDLGEEE